MIHQKKMWAWLSNGLAMTSFVAFGSLNFTNRAYERAAQLFRPLVQSKEHQERIRNQVCIVTGANSGLGREIATQLCKLGCQVHMVCRSQERGQQAWEEIKRECGSNDNLHLHIADISQLDSVQKFARTFQASNQRLDVLINNAGILPLKQEFTDKEGLDMTFATNTAGPYLLCRLLLPLMEKTCNSTAHDMPRMRPRIINVSSGGAYTAKLNPNTNWWHPPPIEKFDGNAVYSQTKRQEIIFTRHLAARQQIESSASPGVLCFSAHPGWAETPGVRSSIPDFYEKFKSLFRTVQQGADGIVWLACCLEVEESGVENGSFFLDRQPQRFHLPLAFTEESEQDFQEFIRNLDALISKYY